jgi:hypothetical protein
VEPKKGRHFHVKRVHRGGLDLQADSRLATANLRQQSVFTAAIGQQKGNEVTVVMTLPAAENEVVKADKLAVRSTILKTEGIKSSQQ